MATRRPSARSTTSVSRGKRTRRAAPLPDRPDRVRTLAKDLTKEFPRSPRVVLGGYVIVARCIDKARAELAGTQGDYTYYPCSLCRLWFDFTGITPAALKRAVATGATDEELGVWIASQSKVTAPDAILRWNNRMRELRPSQLPLKTQRFLEDYIPKNLPPNRPVYVYFDVYDLEERRY
ncbi:MAG: DUF5069 domain-containing protein [Nitrospiraceae bacterium]